ncbi:MAG: TIM barrel protein [Edaphobacter sp.]|uniref:TIM barrel protein n=1 Tax=Edaphobacter sp. TaxID=1934404 RepID=UPI00239F75D1|nr:TIM barrel protein [Edaphobacter sp.]MDE1178611.1 TIM barrel protein [Edaphobacter sp.]
MLSRREFAGVLAASALLTRVGMAQGSSLVNRLSVMIWVLRKRGSFEQNLETVAKAGYRHIELIGEFWQWSDADRERYMAKMAALGITVDATTGMKLGFADPATGDAYIAELKKLIVAAKQVRCSRLILMSGKVLPVGDAAQRAASVATLKRAAEVLEAEGMSALLEPIDHLENPTYWMDGVEEAATITRAVGSPRVRVLYDLYHEQRTRGNLLEKLEKVIDQVDLVHVADVPRRSDPGTGEMAWPVIYRRLKALNYKGMVAMEFYPDGDPVEGLRKARLEAERELG